MITGAIVLALLHVASPDPLAALLGPTACDDPTGACVPKALPSLGASPGDWQKAVDANFGGRNQYGLGGVPANQYTNLSAGKLGVLEDLVTVARPVLIELGMPTEAEKLSMHLRAPGAPMWSSGDELRGDGTRGGYLWWSWMTPKGGVFEVFSVSNFPRNTDAEVLARAEAKFLRRWPGASAEPIPLGRRIRLQSPSQEAGVDLITVRGMPMVVKWVVATDGLPRLRQALRAHLRRDWLQKRRKQLTADSDAEAIEVSLDAVEKKANANTAEATANLEVIAFIDPTNPRLPKLQETLRARLDEQKAEADREAHLAEEARQRRAAELQRQQAAELSALKKRKAEAREEEERQAKILAARQEAEQAERKAKDAADAVRARTSVSGTSQRGESPQRVAPGRTCAEAVADGRALVSDYNAAGCTGTDSDSLDCKMMMVNNIQSILEVQKLCGF